MRIALHSLKTAPYSTRSLFCFFLPELENPFGLQHCIQKKDSKDSKSQQCQPLELLVWSLLGKDFTPAKVMIMNSKGEDVKMCQCIKSLCNDISVGVLASLKSCKASGSPQ